MKKVFKKRQDSPELYTLNGKIVELSVKGSVLTWHYAIMWGSRRDTFHTKPRLFYGRVLESSPDEIVCMPITKREYETS